MCIHTQSADLKCFVRVGDLLFVFVTFPVLLHNALPFVGFGFLDNCIMIVAVSVRSVIPPAEKEWLSGRKLISTGGIFHMLCFFYIQVTEGSFGCMWRENEKNKIKSLLDATIFISKFPIFSQSLFCNLSLISLSVSFLFSLSFNILYIF